MRTIKILFLCLACCLLVSCETVTTKDNVAGIGMFPVRDFEIGVLTPKDFKVLKTVNGYGKVQYDTETYKAVGGDSGKYANLDDKEIARIYFSMDIFEDDNVSAFDVALANAVCDMVEDARKIDAHFISFPAYTVEKKNGIINVHVSGVACQLTNNK